MKSLLIANTVITNKEQAKRLVKKLNQCFDESKSYEMAFVVDELTERLVNVGFLTWEEVEEIA